MDDSSNYDISAQNNVMSSIGGMNQAVKDHNDRIKNTFQQRFKIDESGHKMKEYMTAGHDLSEGVGSLKETGEFIKTVGEARKLEGVVLVRLLLHIYHLDFKRVLLVVILKNFQIK